MTFPLIAQVYKPRKRLKEEDQYKTKLQIGGEIIKKLKEMGFKIKLVLADSEYGENEANFVLPSQTGNSFDPTSKATV